jgi:hypothetical protein
MRAKGAANNRSGCKKKSERWDGMNSGEIPDQSGDRIYQNEQRRNRSGLSNVRPSAK